jgi:hypothetical protein
VTRYALLIFSILLVFFSQKWVTEGSNPGVNLFPKLLLSGYLRVHDIE